MKPEIHYIEPEQKNLPDMQSAGQEQMMLFKVEDVKSNDTDMIGLLKAAGAQYVDKRSNGGRLWVIGEQELSETVAKAKALGYTFRFKKRVAMQPRTNRVGG